MIEIEPLPAPTVRTAGFGAALVQKGARRGGVEQAQGALGLANPGDVEVLLGPQPLQLGNRRRSSAIASAEV